MKGSRLTKTWARAWQRSLRAALKPAPAPRIRKPSATAVAAGTWQAGLAVGAGVARRYRVYRPPGLRPGQAAPLLVMLHGCGQDAQAFADSTRMNALARQQGFVVLYPEQERLANAQGCWNWFDTASGRARQEAASILAAIDQACLLHGADRARVALAGLSAGASMAALLAVQHPQRFVAVAMHSGVPPGTADTAMQALAAMRGRRATSALPSTAQGLPPLLVLQGLADAVVAPANAQAAVRVWAEATAAQAQTRRYTQRGKRYPVAITDYVCGPRLCARLVEIAALGHAWSGGAARQRYSDARGPDASRMVWAFFRSAMGA